MKRLLAPLLAALFALLATACAKPYAPLSFMRWNANMGTGGGGGAVALHPSVYEVIFASEGVGIVQFFDALAAPGEVERLASDDRQILDTLQQQTAERLGVEPTAALPAVELARTLGHHVAEDGNAALSSHGPGGGAAQFSCCRLVTVGHVQNAELFFSVSANEEAAFVRVQRVQPGAPGSGTPLEVVDLAWDLGDVPHAFDPDAELPFATARERMVPMHGSRP